MSSNYAAKSEISEVKTQFLASLNYEIRTPLAGILGMLDLLLETPLTEDQKEMAESSRICAESLLEVMNSALEYSALAAKQVSLEEAEFSLHDFLQTTLDEYSLKVAAKGLTFIRNLAPTLPEVVVGDAIRLKQALGNLLENAIKFTHRGEIEISASSIVQHNCDSLFTFSVRDTGIGIAPDKLESIFESFRQLDTGLSRSYGGMGLGLAVTQELMKLMGAEMTVQSGAGTGSTFFIRIPLVVPSDVTPKLVASNGGMRILLIDGLPGSRLAAINALRGSNVHIDCVDDGDQAIKAMNQAHYDLILLDSKQAGSDGNALRQVSALGDYEQGPILSKPIRSNELVETVERFRPFPKAPAGPSQSATH